MVEFCPKHEKILRKKGMDGRIVLKCPVPGCDYFIENDGEERKGSIRRDMIKKQKIKDNTTRVLTGDEDLALLPKSKEICPKCGHNEAFFKQIQTRSADEPATTFFTCCKCKHGWREY